MGVISQECLGAVVVYTALFDSALAVYLPAT